MAMKIVVFIINTFLIYRSENVNYYFIEFIAVTIPFSTRFQ